MNVFKCPSSGHGCGNSNVWQSLLWVSSLSAVSISSFWRWSTDWSPKNTGSATYGSDVICRRGERPSQGQLLRNRQTILKSISEETMRSTMVRSWPKSSRSPATTPNSASLGLLITTNSLRFGPKIVPMQIFTTVESARNIPVNWIFATKNRSLGFNVSMRKVGTTSCRRCMAPVNP